MSDTFHIKKGDTGPSIRARLTWADGTPVDLSPGGTTVTFRMRDQETEATKVHAAAAPVPGSEAEGLVEYAWVEADTDTVGTYEQDWGVSLNGATYSFPNMGYQLVQVQERGGVSP